MPERSRLQRRSKVARRPINHDAAKGMSYGPEEPRYNPDDDCLPGSGFVLTIDAQRRLHERLRAEQEAKDAAARIMLQKKDADRRAKERSLVARKNRQTPEG